MYTTRMYAIYRFLGRLSLLVHCPYLPGDNIFLLYFKGFKNLNQRLLSLYSFLGTVCFSCPSSRVGREFNTKVAGHKRERHEFLRVLIGWLPKAASLLFHIWHHPNKFSVAAGLTFVDVKQIQVNNILL